MTTSRTDLERAVEALRRQLAARPTARQVEAVMAHNRHLEAVLAASHRRNEILRSKIENNA